MRITIIDSVEFLQNGVSEVILETIKQLHENQNDYQITLIFNGNMDFKYKKILEELSVELIELPNKKKNFVKYLFSLRQAIKKMKTDVIHFHCNNALSTFEILSLLNFKKLVVQCHQDETNHKIIHFLLKPLFNILAKKKIAVSENVAKLCFYRKYKIIHTPINFKRFNFEVSPNERQNIRKKYNIQNKDIILLTIGRLEKQKNYLFSLEVFSKLLFLHTDSKYFIIGDGSLKKDILNKIDELQLTDNVFLITDNKTDVIEYYKMSNVFLLTPIHEALGLVLVEAQMSGLPVYTSSIVDDAVNISNNFFSLPLSIKAEVWAEKIYNNEIINQNDKSMLLTKKKEIFDSKKIVGELVEFYER